MAIPFFSFPKTLQREKEKIRIIEKTKSSSQKEKEQCKEPKKEKLDDTGYGKDVKGKHPLSKASKLNQIQLLKKKVTTACSHTDSYCNLFCK